MRSLLQEKIVGIVYLIGTILTATIHLISLFFRHHLTSVLAFIYCTPSFKQLPGGPTQKGGRVLELLVEEGEGPEGTEDSKGPSPPVPAREEDSEENRIATEDAKVLSPLVSIREEGTEENRTASNSQDPSSDKSPSVEVLALSEDKITATADLDTVAGQRDNAVADDMIADVTASWSAQRKHINGVGKEEGKYVSPFVPYEQFQPIEDAEVHELARWAWGIEKEEDVEKLAGGEIPFEQFVEGLEKLNSIRFDNTLRYWAVMSTNDLGASLHPINYSNRSFWGNNRQVAERENAANYVKCMFFGRVIYGTRKKRDDTRWFQKSLKERFCGRIEDEPFKYKGKKKKGECEV